MLVDFNIGHLLTCFVNIFSVVGEERIVLQPHALEDPPVKELIKVNIISTIPGIIY